MRTYVYIDGFNFYYGAVKDTPYKWVDFKALFQKVLSSHNEILRIKYFTAIVSGKRDPGQPIRQKTFIRALKTHIPEIEVIYGTFLTHPVRMPLECPPLNGPKYASVLKTEEKGSDVNLAVHLVNDAWQDLFDCAVIVSNDSDLAEALRLVKEVNGKMIGLVMPDVGNRIRHPSHELSQYADFVKRIRQGVLKSSQLPDPIPGTSIHKPAAW